ncbi:MAG: HD domain-containing protein [Bacillus sp. (in: firmicutes)]
MGQKEIIELTRAFVKERLYGEGSGHDWWHIQRVCNLATYIARKEEADLFIVEMTALLHDIEDWKFVDAEQGKPILTEQFLQSLSLSQETIAAILNIIQTMSYKGGVVDSTQQTIEGKVVQDADRLDAMGAIGIARAFAFGGNRNRQMYDPSIKPASFQTLEEIKSAENHTINHFYEKLLKLKDRMNTDTAKEIAEKRHTFMEQFLDEFYEEWHFHEE